MKSPKTTTKPMNRAALYPHPEPVRLEFISLFRMGVKLWPSGISFPSLLVFSKLATPCSNRTEMLDMIMP